MVRCVSFYSRGFEIGRWTHTTSETWFPVSHFWNMVHIVKTLCISSNYHHTPTSEICRFSLYKEYSNEVYLLYNAYSYPWNKLAELHHSLCMNFITTDMLNLTIIIRMNSATTGHLLMGYVASHYNSTFEFCNRYTH